MIGVMLMLSSVYLAFPLLSCAGKFLAKVTNRESFVVSQNQTKAFPKEGFSTIVKFMKLGLKPWN